MSIATALVIGLVAGIVAGTLGVGGSIITIPGMVLVAGVDQHVAQGVALVIIVPTALVGTIIHLRQGNVKLNLVYQTTPSAIAFAIIGGWAAGLLDSSLLSILFGILLIIIGLGTIRPKKAAKGC